MRLLSPLSMLKLLFSKGDVMRDLTPQRAAKLELVNHLRKSGLGLIEIRELLIACSYLPKDAQTALG